MRILIHVLSLALIAVAAQAHTRLSASTPADGAVLDAPPEQLTLQFSEPVRLTALSIERSDDGKQDLEPLPSGASAEFSVPAPPLGDGSYVVSWRALSADSHVVSGRFAFALDAAAPPGLEN
ncbi:MAG: copper resistance protein CopC [Gammaproteobacteria bacterium]|nr:copper resistance protein CopC [Gammaproteobacteria bacterium]